ncbi:MAG: ribosome silencing factor [Bacteroidales bacterium]|jgi:ribosome-associated protein|nr:ribosome silencing factor [Bacteroidales bacterium]MDD4395319.1 ribosome silencing factor [Bacteroidales bacterium]
MGKRKVAAKSVEPFKGDIAELIIQALMEKKGEDITIINLKKINHVYFDKFIICSGTSRTHVETLSDYVQEVTKREANIRPAFLEGMMNGEWVLLDYFDIIVHIFQPETRNFYRLESLWNDAEIKHL